jgi:hypothetical protein
MKPLLPGQAAVTIQDGKVSFVLCDLRENLPLGPARFEVKAVLHEIAVGRVTVPVVTAVVRLIAGDTSRFYAAWIDEQADGVLELLAAQAEMTVILASPLGERIGQAVTDNGARAFAIKVVGTVAALASKAPWNPQEFAAAQLAVMAQYFAAGELWRQLGE